MSRPEVELVPVKRAHVLALVAGMRQQDRDELTAWGYPDARLAVRESVRDSVWCRTCLVDGEVAAITGLARGGSDDAPFGIPWLLGTELVPKHGRVLARYARAYIPEMLQVYPRLINHVHAKNTVAVAWLRRIGFSLREPHQHPPTGEPFHVFEMHADGRTG
jgi:hypothetical protein